MNCAVWPAVARRARRHDDPAHCARTRAEGTVPRMAGERGFTLIETMIVVLIAGLLVTVAFPSYREHVVKSHRAAAQQELFDLAALQEKIFLNSNAYTVDVSTAYNGQATAGLGQTDGNTADARYTLSLSVPGGAQSFTLTATPVAGTTQAGDGNMTIASDGVRTWGSENW